MTSYIAIAIFVGSWLSGVILTFVIKKRLKALYPDLHNQLFARNLLEHNIAKSLEFQKFALRSSQWSEIEDKWLLLWLKLSRGAFLLMVTLLIAFLAVVLAGLAFYVFTGNK